MLGRMAALLVGAATLAQPTFASPTDCSLIKAIAQPGADSLRGVGTEMDDLGMIKVSYQGQTTSLAGATGCELSGPEDIFRLGCNWSEPDLQTARSAHSQIKSALAPCLSDAFVLQDYTSTVEGLEVSQYYKGHYSAMGGGTAEVSLEIHHYADIDGSYAVVLSISR